MAMIIAIIAGFILMDIIIVIYVTKYSSRIGKKEKDEYRRKWRVIANMKNRNNRILEAEKIVDHVMTKLGYNGSFADKMKKGKEIFSNYNGLWYAHKTRNKIAHEIGFCCTEKQADEAIKFYSRALHDLDVL